MYSPNVIVNNKTFCLSLHYNGDNGYLFVIGKQVIKFKSINTINAINAINTINDPYAKICVLIPLKT